MSLTFPETFDSKSVQCLLGRGCTLAGPSAFSNPDISRLPFAPPFPPSTASHMAADRGDIYPHRAMHEKGPQCPTRGGDSFAAGSSEIIVLGSICGPNRGQLSLSISILLSHSELQPHNLPE
jgi:hypothetical protein